MGELRDWRQSFRDLELDRLNLPDPVEAQPVRLEPVFPPDIVIPPSMGAAIIGVPLVPAPQPQVDAEADLILPAPVPKPQPAKRKAAPKRATGRKAPAKKKPRKPAAKKPKSDTATRRSTVGREPVSVESALPAHLSAAPALPAPLRPLPPLPRSASVTPYRKGGVFAAMGFWLRSTVRGKHAESERELARLRAENESLRRQLEALTALREAAEFRLPGLKGGF